MNTFIVGQRRGDNVSAFKKGQRVQIKSKEEIAKTLSGDNYHKVTNLYFNNYDMKKYIGATYAVKHVGRNSITIETLGEHFEDVVNYCWHPDWLKPTSALLDEAEEL